MATISLIIYLIALNCVCIEIYAIHFLPTNVHRHVNRKHHEFLKEISDLEIPISNSNQVAKLRPITTKEQQISIEALVDNIIGQQQRQQVSAEANTELVAQNDDDADDAFNESGSNTATTDTNQSNDLDNLYYNYYQSAGTSANILSGIYNNKPTLNRLGCKPNLVGTSGYKISCTDKLDRLLHAAYVRIASNFEKMVDQLRNDAKTMYERRLTEQQQHLQQQANSKSGTKGYNNHHHLQQQQPQSNGISNQL